MQLQVLGVWWLACILWSSTYLFIRLGLADVPPWTFAWLRLLLALAILIPITAARGGFADLRRRDAVQIMCAGVLLLGVNYALVYWGAQFIPSGLVATLQSATPLVALGLGWCFGVEAVTIRKLVAFSTGILGVALIFHTEARASGSSGLAGTLAVVGSSACVAFAYVWLKRYPRQVPRLTVTTLQCLAGLVPLAALAFALEGSPLRPTWSTPSIVALLYLALCGSVVAFWLNYWLLDRIDASAMLMMGVAEVPIAIALGAVIFGERLPAGTFLGAACILIGVVVGPMTTPAVSPTSPRAS